MSATPKKAAARKAASRTERQVRAIELIAKTWKPLERIKDIDGDKSLTEFVHRILNEYIKEREAEA